MKCLSLLLVFVCAIAPNRGFGTEERGECFRRLEELREASLSAYKSERAKRVAKYERYFGAQGVMRTPIAIQQAKDLFFSFQAEWERQPLDGKLSYEIENERNRAIAERWAVLLKSLFDLKVQIDAGDGNVPGQFIMTELTWAKKLSSTPKKLMAGSALKESFKRIMEFSSTDVEEIRGVSFSSRYKYFRAAAFERGENTSVDAEGKIVYLGDTQDIEAWRHGKDRLWSEFRSDFLGGYAEEM